MIRLVYFTADRPMDLAVTPFTSTELSQLEQPAGDVFL
jgi:hypothetical protein